MLHTKYLSIALALFGAMCGIFGFFTEVKNIVVVIPSSFYLQMAMFSFLAAIYIEIRNKHR